MLVYSKHRSSWLTTCAFMDILTEGWLFVWNQSLLLPCFFIAKSLLRCCLCDTGCFLYSHATCSISKVRTRLRDFFIYVCHSGIVFGSQGSPWDSAPGGWMLYIHKLQDQFWSKLVGHEVFVGSMLSGEETPARHKKLPWNARKQLGKPPPVYREKGEGMYWLPFHFILITERCRAETTAMFFTNCYVHSGERWPESSSQMGAWKYFFMERAKLAR